MVRPVIEVLAEIDAGKLLEEFTDAYAKVSEAVMSTGLKGQVVLTLDFKQNKGNQLFVKSTLKKKIPEEGIAEATFFCGEDGSLTRRDPKQLELLSGLREVV